MATLDQLPADRRAIIELVLERGQSYEELSSVLGMSEKRVRDHAREALASLAPRSAGRVDPHWRGQIADYVLGQQSGPEAKATRGHLRSSEAARTWALSVLDSVGHLYRNGAEPHIPGAGGRPEPEPEPPRRSARRVAAGAVAERARDRTPDEEDDEDREEPRRRPRERRPRRSYAPSDPTTRRRIVAGLLAAAALVGLVLLLTGVLGGDDEEPATADDAAAEEASAEPEVVAELVLEPVGGADARGGAIIAEQAGQPILLMQARVPPPRRGETYVVWLYNSAGDAIPVAPLAADRQGNVQALSVLPPQYEDYRFLDVSAMPEAEVRSLIRAVSRSAQLEQIPPVRHAGTSVLRGPITAAPAGEALPEGELTPPPAPAPVP